MAEQKSKLPDFNEITGMAGKLFGDIKSSITDIIKDYKEKHAVEATETVAPAPQATPAEKVDEVKKEEVKAAPVDVPTTPVDTENKSEETKSE